MNECRLLDLTWSEGRKELYLETVPNNCVSTSFLLNNIIGKYIDGSPNDKVEKISLYKLDIRTALLEKGVDAGNLLENYGDSIRLLTDGTPNHDLLLNRDLPEQHPITAISGLSSQLDGINNELNIIKEDTAELQLSQSEIIVEKDFATLQDLIIWANTVGNMKKVREGTIFRVLEDSSPDFKAVWDNSSRTFVAKAIEPMHAEKIIYNDKTVAYYLEVQLPRFTESLIIDHNSSDQAHSDIRNELIQLIRSIASAISDHDSSQLAHNGLIPRNTSEITNDSGFITKEVNSLTNYYTKSEIDSILGGV